VLKKYNKVDFDYYYFYSSKKPEKKHNFEKNSKLPNCFNNDNNKKRYLSTEPAHNSEGSFDTEDWSNGC